MKRKFDVLFSNRVVMSRATLRQRLVGSYFYVVSYSEYKFYATMKPKDS